MKAWERKFLRLEQDLMQFKKENLAIKERIEQRRDSINHRLLGLEVLTTEIKQRLTALEGVKNPLRNIDIVERQQVSSNN